jgi:hypothetical protein
MQELSPNPSLDPLEDILGAHFAPDRLKENLSAFREVLKEIQKLRELDLTDVHPVIIYDPLTVYRTGETR